jgi:hypothetical protein
VAVTASDDPRPDTAPGLEPGGGVRPGDTPPSDDQMSGAVEGPRDETPNQGPVSGNRTPMIATLVVLGIVVLMVALVVGASFFPSD